MKTISRICIFIFLLSASFTLLAASNNTQISEAGNTYMSGGDLKVTIPVTGDLLAAGGRVSVEREVGADAAIAGGSVDIRAPVGQDLRVAAGAINIDANVDGELVAAGGSVRVQESAAIAGSAWLAGSNIVLGGKVAKGAKIYANTITLLGEIDGNTHLYAQEIHVMPGARINGNLSYASANALTTDEAAQVFGTITREQTPQDWNVEQRKTQIFPWFLLVFILSMLATGTLLYLLLPNAIIGAQRMIKQHPVHSLLTGLALLFAIPPAAILMMITVIGIPIGLTLLALYPLMLLLAYLTAAFFIGRQVANAMKQPQELTLGRQMLFLALALAILSAIAWIPYLGKLILIATLIMGIGGWAVWIQTQYNTNKASQN